MVSEKSVRVRVICLRFLIKLPEVLMQETMLMSFLWILLKHLIKFHAYGSGINSKVMV